MTELTEDEQDTLDIMSMFLGGPGSELCPHGQTSRHAVEPGSGVATCDIYIECDGNPMWGNR